MELMKKEKTYQKYKDEAARHNKSIMDKYGAPPEAKPPRDRDYTPRSQDTQFRAMAFTKKTTLENWIPANKRRGE